MKKKIEIVAATIGILLIIGIIQSIINPTEKTNMPENDNSSQITENNSSFPNSNTVSDPMETIASNTDASEESIYPSKDIEIDPKELNGRGISDSSREEPDYVGIVGYAVIGSEQEYILEQTDEFTKIPWTILLSNGETLEHKTEVLVKSQELNHEGWGNYSGFLTVERTDTKEEIILNVKNFITKPYWTYENLNEAAQVGYYMAEYHQIGPNYPVTRDNEKVDLEDGYKILVVGLTGMYGGDAPDRNVNSVEGIVFKEWRLGYGGVSVFFDPQDLTIIY